MIHRAKKSMGQNFLKSKSVLAQVVAAGELSPQDTVLEIGPGKGALTELLLQSAGKVVAVETDYVLFEFLKDKFANEIKSGRLELHRGDILSFDSARSDLAEYKIIANIPYNITGAILQKFLTTENQPSLMVLMIQKEVAQRIVAEKGSLLSISVKAYGKPKIVGRVSKRFFSPQPKVDSTIIKISDISREVFGKSAGREESFWKIVHAGFAHKRKKLSGNLKNIFPPEKLLVMGLADKRAEDLPISDWIALSEML